VGDVRSAAQAAEAVAMAARQQVLAVLRISRAAGAFGRLIDMGIPADRVATVCRCAFSLRLFRRTSGRDDESILVCERLVVTPEVRELIQRGADETLIHRQVMVEGMRTLRETAEAQVRLGRLTLAEAHFFTPDD
jgi:type II secretory ATPase GspE/PulE/Tfp pilus assembly ATPase PilB-like protein